MTDLPPDLTPNDIRAALHTRVLGQRLEVLGETSSTNSVALELAQQDAPHGTVVLADAQRAGRGRLGRTWYSPGGVNLHASILLRTPPAPPDLPRWLSWLPLVTGVAIARALTQAGLRGAALKWPNDILLDEKKAGGVLCESTGVQHRLATVALGIGLNVNSDPATFPEEFRAHSTSLAAAAGRRFQRGLLLAGVLDALEPRLALLAEGRWAELADEYRGCSATLGQAVRVEMAGGESRQGIATAIQADGALELTPQGGGNPIVIRVGDVVHLRAHHEEG